MLKLPHLFSLNVLLLKNVTDFSTLKLSPSLYLEMLIFTNIIFPSTFTHQLPPLLVPLVFSCLLLLLVLYYLLMIFLTSLVEKVRVLCPQVCRTTTKTTHKWIGPLICVPCELECDAKHHCTRPYHELYASNSYVVRHIYLRYKDVCQTLRPI